MANVGQEVAASGVGDVVGEVLDWALASDDGLCAEACKKGRVITIYSNLFLLSKFSQNCLVQAAEGGFCWAHGHTLKPRVPSKGQENGQARFFLYF